MSEVNAVPVPAHPQKARRSYEADIRERALLPLTLALGALLADLVLTCFRRFACLEVTVLVLAWEGVLFWYTRRDGGPLRARLRGPGGWLSLCACALALPFALYSNRWFWLPNLCALAGVLTVQMFEVAGPAERPWTSPLMLPERALLLLEGSFGRLGAPFYAASSVKKGPGRRGMYVLIGICCVLPVLLLVVPLLTAADAVFGYVTDGAVRFLRDHFGALALRIFLGLLLVPFLYGLLYFLRRGERRPAAGRAVALPGVDPALTVTVLLPLDLLYLLFVAVQSAALFGGPGYLAAAGVSYAGYARSGFFQLVWVSGINLAVVVASVHFCRREGRLWMWTRVLATAMAALSGVMLFSAAWRMTLYVGTYGLSLKRALTYWGMAMLGIFLTAALLKVWRREFGFFRVLFAAGVAGWLLLNALNLDAVVARHNVNAYLGGELAAVDVSYLAYLSYDALPILEKLPGDLPVYGDVNSPALREYTLEGLISQRRNSAAREAGAWQTWNLSAWLAAR